MEEETRRAVETEFGRVYWGIVDVRTSGEKGEEVRKRIDRWNESVERAESITNRIFSIANMK